MARFSGGKLHVSEEEYKKLASTPSYLGGKGACWTSGNKIHQLVASHYTEARVSVISYPLVVEWWKGM